jgi:hypothetical protein
MSQSKLADILHDQTDLAAAQLGMNILVGIVPLFAEVFTLALVNNF